MIQRIQTVFLIIAAILNAGVYFTPVYEKGMNDPQMWIGIGLAVSLFIALALSIASVLLYNDRMKQIQWVKYAAFVQVIALAFCVGIVFSLGGFGTYLWDEALSTAMVLAGLVFHILAIRFIKKDEDLVRSMDRIR